MLQNSSSGKLEIDSTVLLFQEVGKVISK